MITLGPKLVVYGRANADPRLEDEIAVAHLLETHGWVRTGVVDLTIDGGLRAQIFQTPNCRGEIRVSVMSPTGQDAALAETMAGPRDQVLFAYRGALLQKPPRSAIWKERLARLAESLHLWAGPHAPLLALVIPSECDVPSDWPWRRLDQPT